MQSRFNLSMPSCCWLAFFMFGALGCPMAFAQTGRGTELADGRTKLTSTNNGMARFVGLVYFDDPRANKAGEIRRGTGTVIGPRHVLTVAHNLTHSSIDLNSEKEEPYPKGSAFGDDFPSEIYFAPGQHGDLESPTTTNALLKSQPFGRAKVVEIYMQSMFKSTSNANLARECDIAVLRLDRDVAKDVGGQATLLAAANDRGLLNAYRGKFHINGYDADLGKKTQSKPREKFEVWQVTRTGDIRQLGGGLLDPLRSGIVGRTTRFGLRLSSVFFDTELPAYSGASGAPLWIEDQTGNPVIVGIVQTSNTQKYTTGVVFDQGYIDWINAFVNANVEKTP